MEEPSDKIKKKYDVYGAAKKATSIKAGPSALQETGQSILDKFIETIGGVTGLPMGADSQYRRGLDVAAAGIPFIAPLGKVFHGTPSRFTHFNPALHNKMDTLGSYVHFAEQPEMADKWATQYKTGAMRSNIHEVSPQYKRWEEGTNLIPAKLNVKNALDLSSEELDPRDFTKILKVLNPQDREELARVWKAEQDAPQYRAGSTKAHISYHLTNNPDLLERAGFDGVRYHDTDAGPSWAIPRPEQASTPWGTSLGLVPNQRLLDRMK